MTPPDEHEWVDLGLPSGTLWATCNVGASSPEEKGDYFAWGETTPKDYYDWSNYKWCNGSDSTLTKYCNNSDCGYNGFVDNKMELDPEDDAAYVNWGPSWRMPTKEQQDELREYCTIELGYKGYLVTGPNGNTLFFPCSGYRYHDTLYVIDSEAIHQSRALNSSNPCRTYALNFIQNYFNWCAIDRFHGMTVRAVRVSQN